MAEDKMQWFPVYWERFLLGTMGMSAEEVGAYFLMIIYQWDKGFLPEDDKELKKITRVSVKKLSKVLEKFEKIGDKYFNNTLEIIRIEQKEKNEKNHSKGIKGAKARWDKHKLSIAQALLKQCPEDAIREEKNREDKNRTEERETPAPELNYEYMIGEDEILSIHETFKEKFPVLFQTACSQYGELKIKNWTTDFGNLHKQKTWKDYQDFRQHLSNYFSKRSLSKDVEIKGKIGPVGNIIDKFKQRQEKF